MQALNKSNLEEKNDHEYVIILQEVYLKVKSVMPITWGFEKPMPYKMRA